MAATMLLNKRITSPVGVVAPLVNGGCSMSDLKESYRVFKEKAQLITFQLLEQAKERASVLWLVSKAHNNRVPTELRDPYYRDHEDQYRLKPQIVQGLSSGELYCMALASIYADPNYHTLSHVGIISALQKKGVEVLAPADGTTTLNETTLTQNAPIRMAAHMSVIEAIMDLYIKEVLIPLKVFEVVRRYSEVQYPDEVPVTSEEAALLWINAATVALRERVQLEAGQPVPPATIMQDMAELSDGCGLSSLLSFYCPDALPWQELCLNDPMNLTDSLCNLQLVQAFCEQNLPHDICFLTLEDLLFMHETIRPNMLALVADLMYLFEIRPAKCVVKPGWELEDDNDLPQPQEEVQYNYTLRKARKLQNSCSHIPDLLLQPEGMLQRDKKGRPQRTSGSQDSHREAHSHSKDSNKDENTSDPEELEQFSGYFNKMNISAPSSTTGAGNGAVLERNSHSTHASPAHRNNNNRRGSPDKTGRESSQDGNSTLENYYTQFNSIEDRSHDGEGGQPLRRVPSQSHIQNFSGSQAALQMMDPDAPDPFEGARDNKQTSFAQLSSQDCSSQVNFTYKAERRSKKPTTTWMQQTPTGDEGGDVEEMFAVRQQMDERRQRIEQERRAAQEAAKKERTQANKQVFQQVVGGGTRVSQGVSNGNSSGPISVGRGDDIPGGVGGGGTSTSEESDRRSPTPPPNDQQKRRRNSAERVAKQEQVLNSLIHSRSASHVNHLSGTGQPTTFYLHDAGSPIHGYPSAVMRRQWGPPAAPPAAMFGGFGPMGGMPGTYPGEIMPPYWASPQPSWGASQPPQSLNHTMLQQQQQQAHPFVQQPYNLHEPSVQQQQHQQQMHLQIQHEQHRIDQVQIVQQQQHLQQAQPQQQQQQIKDVGYQERTKTPSPPPPARPERKKRDTGTSASGRISEERVDQQENTPPTTERTQERERDGGSFFISFGDDNGGDTKGTVIKPKPKLRPRIQPGRDEADTTVTSLCGGTRPVSMPTVSTTTINSMTITKSEGRRLSTRLDSSIRSGSGVETADNASAPVTKTQPSADGFVIGDGKSLSDVEMARRKEMIMMASLKRRQQQEQLRLRKENEQAMRRAHEQARRDEAERKREDDKRRREIILEQYRLRKAQEEAEKNGAPPVHHASLMAGSTPNGSIQRRPKSRSASVTRPRPKSVHIGSSLASQATGGPAGGDSLSYSSVNSHTSNSTADVTARRLSMGGSQQGLDSVGRGNTGAAVGIGSLKREPSYPDFSRYRNIGPPSDGASDTASTSSLFPGEYTGPKLFVKPSAKSNRSIILNALNVVLAGAVNADTKKRATNEINATDAKHLLILFRGANLQFRGIYTYNPDREEVVKIFGAGPKNVTESMLDLFYKYNSGSKGFTQIHTKHLSATIDAFTIQNSLWTVRKSVTSKFAASHHARSGDFM
ncbi:patronin-like isoform X2 [Varroa jacobsoni]|uniref:patronin-like isoform X2 n=1 Tax=Varroa jacobsoni TaxID=62625 RepID=UPI000BF3E52C|nr:patronin-like isoform X2 [Varroa jacobsoni]